jgi:TGF-beta propeptide
MRRVLTLVLAAICLACPAPGSTSSVSIAPSADVGLPFWCDWSYDWEARCFREDGPRLPIGGVDDKVWRAALRFPLAAVPAGATVTGGELRIYYDGLCVAPAREARPCAAPGAVVDAHRLLAGNWFSEREPDFDLHVEATAVVFSAPDPQWLAWDVTSVVRRWQRALVPNNGLLLKLQDGDEDFAVGGPYGPSAGSLNAGLRPRLVVTYSGPGPH